MSTGAAGDSLLKAQVQNCNEKNKFDLRKREIETNLRRSLFVISNNMREIREALREIQASTGCSKWAGPNAPVPAPENLPFDSPDNPPDFHRVLGLTDADTGRDARGGNVERRNSNACVTTCGPSKPGPPSRGENPSGSPRETGAGSNSRKEPLAEGAILSCLGTPESYGESVEIQKMNGRLKEVHSPQKEDPGHSEQLLSLEFLDENSSDAATKKAKNRSTRFLISADRGKIADKKDNQDVGSLTGTPIPHWSRNRSRSAPVPKKMRKNMRVKSAPGLFSKDDGGNAFKASNRSSEAVFRSTRLSASEFGGHNRQVFHMTFEGLTNSKSRVKVSLSKAEKERALKELILSSSTPVDRTIFEKAKQKLLQEKITAFIESITLLAKEIAPPDDAYYLTRLEKNNQEN